MGRCFVDKVKQFKIYSVSKSTALVVAVLPLFLSEKLHLSQADIVLIGSYFLLLPLILEVPLGLLSDVYGSKRVIYTGLFFFLCGFLALFMNYAYFAYATYLLCITLAAACFSGAEDSLLFSVVPKHRTLFSVKSEVAAVTYSVTTVLIFLGGILYYVHPALPVIFQVLSLIFAIFMFSKLTKGLDSFHINAHPSIFTVMCASRKEVKNPYRFTLIFLSAVSAFAILVNNRTVSIAFSDFLPFQPAILVSIIFIIGNFFSASSNILFQKYFSKFQNPIFPVLMIGCMVTIAFFLMSFQIIAALILGFLLLCVFKSAYRSYLSSLLINSLLDPKAIATVLSFTAIITAVVSFAFSFLYGHIFSTFWQANLWLAVVMAVIFGVSALIIFVRKQEIIWLQPENAQSSKQHFLKRKHQEFCYGQIYPEASCINENIKDGSFRQSLYPAPNLITLCDEVVEWEFIRGTVLSQMDLLHQKAIIDQINKIFQDRLSKNIILSHGDLHPDNIIVTPDSSFMVVDWDLCQEASPELDILTFFTSPRLSLNLEERIDYISHLLSISKDEALPMIKAFVAKKISDLCLYQNIFMKQLVLDYMNLNKEFHGR